IGFNERTDRQEAECAYRGKHLPSGGASGSGWVICNHCGIPLERPDGGPVVLSNGGPLAPAPAGRNPEFTAVVHTYGMEATRAQATPGYMATDSLAARDPVRRRPRYSAGTPQVHQQSETGT